MTLQLFSRVRPYSLRLQHTFRIVPVFPNFSTNSSYTDMSAYDLVVLGGGSGGVSCAQQARSLGAKVALLDYVAPSPHGTTWGLGGTCVNVGCIPKKLMHHAALLGEATKEAESFGWSKNTNDPQINWDALTTAVNNHIKSVNWLTRVGLREGKVDYLNAWGRFIDANTIEATDKDGKKTQLIAKNVVIAVGGRPRYLDIPGAKLAITSDDIFSLKKPPGRTLIIGAGYIALETAGFLKGLGFSVTVMVRAQVLRGFDQQMAQLLVDNLTARGVRFIRDSTPKSFEKKNDRIRVAFGDKTKDFDTVMFAVGRAPATAALNLDAAGVAYDAESKKIFVENERTNVEHIYAVGDVLYGKLELTPVAIQAGKLLARRLFAGETTQMNYDNVATTIFTPLEYGCVGLSEETALERHGEDNIEVFHGFYKPTEFLIPEKSFAQCYMKVICLRYERTVLGLHFIGPVAGEVIQGYAVAITCGVKMEQITDTVGIHPTVSEEFTRLFITKRSGIDPSPQICCS